MEQAWAELIEVNPQILAGKPVIRGTRIPVELVLELLATGRTPAEILAEYPHLKEEQIRACMAYALDLVKSERVYPVG